MKIDKILVNYARNIPVLKSILHSDDDKACGQLEEILMALGSFAFSDKSYYKYFVTVHLTKFFLQNIDHPLAGALKYNIELYSILKGVMESSSCRGMSGMHGVMEIAASFSGVVEDISDSFL